MMQPQVIEYGKVDGIGLNLHLYKGEQSQIGPNVQLAVCSAALPPIVVFFFGGGWVDGSLRQFESQCRFFAKRGICAIAAEYRVTSRHASTPFDSVEDARTAIRWIRQQSVSWGLEHAPIVAGGGSAGGHLALCAAMFPQDTDKDGPDYIPDALLLYNPVVDTTSTGFAAGVQRFNGREHELSPTHAIHPNLPPMLIFHGTEDKAVPLHNVIQFQRKMEAAGNRCELCTFKGRGHGFFNHPSFFHGASLEDYERVLAHSLRFLQTLC